MFLSGKFSNASAKAWRTDMISKSALFKTAAAAGVALAVFPAAAIPFGEFLQQNFLYAFLSAVSTNQKPTIETLPQLITPLICFFIFLFMYIQFLYKDFISSAVYIFIRQKSRTRWYCVKSARLLGSAFVYYALYFFTGFAFYLLCAANASGGTPGLSGIPSGQLCKTAVLCLTLTVLYSLFSFFFLLILNLLAIVFNMVCGYIAVSLSALFFMVSSCLAKAPYAPAFKLNPVVQLIPDWHSKNMFAAPPVKISNFPISFSVIYLLLLCTAAFFAGAVIIKRTDITLDTKD